MKMSKILFAPQKEDFNWKTSIDADSIAFRLGWWWCHFETLSIEMNAHLLNLHEKQKNNSISIGACELGANESATYDFGAIMPVSKCCHYAQ